jgi:phosphohistidine swiveling domain-containing protein
MTRPEIVPFIKNATAIVTDEGGITCHAAIVSRELRIPCVVGTKRATQVFHDGDIVEVDAYNGVVKFLKRKNESKNELNDERIEFKKSYSRDTTLFMQGLWAKGLNELARSKFGWENPHLPFIAHYVNDGVVEIWEHEKAIGWFLDKLYESNKNEKFLAKLLKEYKELLVELKKLHAKEYLSNIEDKKRYESLVYQAAFDMTIFFYTGMDERNPEVAKNISVLARKEGDFFADNDVFVRKNIARLGGISEELAGVVLPEEINNIPNFEILSGRLKSYLIIDGKEVFAGELSEYAKQHFEFYFRESEMTDRSAEISGQTAYKGNIKGRVHIVRKQSDMSGIEAGDILVSPMTTPDFLPAMKLASAFVTDEGGVTCHAAIVAREMKKPCIIGTKIATQVLHDGDMVEVDADNGVVRILK